MNDFIKISIPILTIALGVLYFVLDYKIVKRMRKSEQDLVAWYQTRTAHGGQVMTPTSRVSEAFTEWCEECGCSDTKLMEGYRTAFTREYEAALSTGGDVTAGHLASNEVRRAANLLEKIPGRHTNDNDVIQRAVAYLRDYALVLT